MVVWLYMVSVGGFCGFYCDVLFVKWVSYLSILVNRWLFYGMYMLDCFIFCVLLVVVIVFFFFEIKVINGGWVRGFEWLVEYGVLGVKFNNLIIYIYFLV